jgi:23S rRNA (cytosine1962-C5)-methyltransferase
MSLTLTPQQIVDQLKSAFRYRGSLSLNSNAMRLVNGQGDQLPGLIIDRFNKHFAVYILDVSWQAHQAVIQKTLIESFEVDYLVFKDRTVSDTRSASELAIKPAVDRAGSATVVEENGLRFSVDLNDHLNQGLFLDMRKNRRLLASFAKDKAVLNCFAYTCSFGAYCRRFGATRVVNVDISAKYLKRGEENYKLNHLPTGRSEFMREHAVHYVERAGKRNNLFDIIILDPPSFSRYEGSVFSAKKDLPRLIESAMNALTDTGILFVSTNLSTISRPQMEEWAHVAAKKSQRKIVEIDRLSQDIDFRGSGLMKESFLSALLLKTNKHK